MTSARPTRPGHTTAKAQTAGAHRPPLSVARIAAEAIAMADQEGLEALSMRRLAERLGVEAMSLYHHLPSKAALFEAMADQLGGSLPAPPDLPWRESLRTAAYAWRDLAREHPGAFPLLATRASHAPALVERVAAVVTQLRAAGFTPAASVRAFSSLITALNGFLLAAGVPAVSRDVPEPGIDDPTLAEMSGALSDIPAEAWVLTSDAAFEFHVTMLLDGLQAALDRGAG
jgi:AcrR family transcriptional regulator